MEPRIIHVIMNYSWKHQYEHMLSLTSIDMIAYSNIYRCLYIQVSIYTYISLLYQLQGPKGKNIPIARRTQKLHRSISIRL